MPHDEDLACATDRRRELLAGSGLNGIDAVEVPSVEEQTRIRVYFVEDPVPAVDASQVHVDGGVRITGIDVVSVAEATDELGLAHLEVRVDRAGDFSDYTLAIDAPGVLDPRLAHHAFSFKAACPSDFDCRVESACPPDAPDEPAIDYLAKDYASFRQLLVERMGELVPEWSGDRAAELGTTLIELLAYEGDHISYAQDAVANEMHLDSARRRESVRRHVGLIDYPMHEGLTATTFVHVAVATPGTIPARSLRCPEQAVRVATRIGEPVAPGASRPPQAVIDQAAVPAALEVADEVFEPLAPAAVHPARNHIPIHTWRQTECCLPAGATSVDLVYDPAEAPFAAGELLLLEEVKGVRSGLERDADPAHRQVVRIADVTWLEDPLLTADPAAPGGARPRGDGEPALAVTRVSWEPADALGFPLCVSTVDADGAPLREVAAARGNIVAVDHGATRTETHTPDAERVRYSQIGYRFRLAEGPLAFGLARGQGVDRPAAELATVDPRDAEPHVIAVDADGDGFAWLPAPDLLGAGPFTRAFVAEPDHDGRALLRFGDGTHGRAPTFPTHPGDAGARLQVTYRVGGGRAGNVGAESIAHVLEPEVFPADWPAISRVYQPVAAAGGADPETLATVKQHAPEALHTHTYRAVTEADYAAYAEEIPAVARARASLRWTGSWHTVFVSVDPRGTDTLTEATAAEVARHVDRYRQAGYDLAVTPPRYVPLEVELFVCAGAEHFRGDVHAAVLEALSAGTRPGGARGFFHPDHFTFGQPLHLSALYAAVEAVTGVAWAEVTVLQRFGRSDAGELDAGRVDVARLEVLQLHNDPNHPEHGVLSVEVGGGK